jgi:hypothetical protein
VLVKKTENIPYENAISTSSAVFIQFGGRSFCMRSLAAAEIEAGKRMSNSTIRSPRPRVPLPSEDKPKSTEKLESKTTKNLEMEPKQRGQPAKSTAEGAAIPMPWYTNMDDNNGTNTSTTNEDKNKDGHGIKALKRGRQSSKEKSATQVEEVLVSPPQKKAAIESNKGMEVCEIKFKN